MRKLFFSLLCGVCCASSVVWGQTSLGQPYHLTLGATGGTTGFGLDLSMPLNDHVVVRAGASILPRMREHGRLNILLNGEAADPTYNDKGLRTDKMGQMQRTFSSLTGLTFNEDIGIYLYPTIHQFKVLVDWYPFQKKNWHFTAGVFAGPSTVARLYSDEDDMQSLINVALYNTIYQHCETGEPVTIGSQTFNVTSMGLDKWFLSYGRMTLEAGTDKQGEKRGLTTGNDGRVRARASVNRVRPYLGAGYSYYFGKNDRNAISLDAGCIFWGGTPHVYTLDGTCLTHDMQRVEGDLGEWVDYLSQWKVYPLIELRLSRRIF